jgi:hypothetical protein
MSLGWERTDDVPKNEEETKEEEERRRRSDHPKSREIYL